MSTEYSDLPNLKKSYIEWLIKLDILQITYDGRYFFIDLIFYNYLLKCFVLTIGIVLCTDKSDSIVYQKIKYKFCLKV